MDFYYNPLEKICKSYTGAVPRGQAVTFHILADESGEVNFSAQACYFVYFKDGNSASEIPMNRDDSGFSVTLKFNRIGLYFYYFRFGDRYFGLSERHCGKLCDDPHSWQLTVFEEDFETPDWMKGGVMYQIFPDRFYKSGDYPIADNKILRKDWGGIPNYKPNEFGKVLNNDFFGGNLNGIREKLDYLKSLGVSVIYLNPIFEAYSNHRYDTGDYMQIDPLLGTAEDFDRLIADAKEKGIRIVLDGVFNHTGDDSRYFNKYGRYKQELGAHQSPDSPYSGWYCFSDFPDRYDSWWGIETLPAVNEQSQSYQDFIFGKNGVLKNWLRHGIGGYRLDVADELPDFFLEKLRHAVKEETSDAVIIGEVWEDASNKIAYSQRRKYLLGLELDSVMNYPLKDAIINFVMSGTTFQLRETIAMLIDHYPKQVLDNLMNVLGTHDTARILTVFGGKNYSSKDEMARSFLSAEEREKAMKCLKMAVLLQYTMPGIPCIYYGDEIGMEGYHDPFCRRCFDWSRQENDLTEYYRKIGNIRTNELKMILKEGSYREIFADRYCIVYERKIKNRSAIVYVNNSAGKYNIKLRGTYYEHLSQTNFNGNVEFGAYSYGILTKMP